MKTAKLLLTVFVLWTGVLGVASAQVYSINIVGYVNLPFVTGDNLFGNPLDNNTNKLNSIFSSSVPDGSTLTKWDAQAHQFLPSSIFSDGSWSINYDLAPGEGALFHATAAFTNTFVGTVLTGPGSTGGDITPPTPPVLGNGLYLLSSLFPASGRTFQDMIGRDPHEGEWVRLLDPASQTYFTTTYTGGAWDHGDPSIDIARGAYFNLGPVLSDVPEPGTCSFIASLGFVAYGFQRRFRHLHSV